MQRDMFYCIQRDILLHTKIVQTECRILSLLKYYAEV